MPDKTELRREIEEMAFRTVMAGQEGASAPDWEETWITLLDRLQQPDSGLGPQVTDAAAGLKQALGKESGAGELQDAIARLQEAMEAGESAAPPAALAQDPELMRDFVLESGEHLVNIESRALILERDPADSEALNSVFRGFHTIKGLAGFLELWDVQKLAHEVETVLDSARNGEFTLGSAAIDAILESADYLRRWLAHLQSVLDGQASATPPSDEKLLARIRDLSSERAKSGAEPGAIAALEVLAAAVEGAPPETPPNEPAAAAKQRVESSAVKVDTSKLDYLVDMAGEMVIAQSMVQHDPELSSNKSPRLQRNMAQLARITAELQKTAMAMRLVPVGPLFRRMARLVRDLSRQFGKPVDMETEGDEIELDRHIVEELADPLMHMVRNALDHGIECPADRERAGKNPVAKVILRGRHHAGQVVIEIADDGRGLDRGKIVAKAIQKGLISSADGMCDNDVFNLIFQPGFTTAAQVTNVSGRGVGMDVVRRHIEKLRGRMEIRSVVGQGATFLLKLPLTLAIIDGLVVGVGGERYIAPLFGVREVLRPGDETIWTVQERSEMALIRGQLLPVIRLYRRFHVKPRSEDPRNSVLLVAEVEGRRFCILVDEVIGKQEVVIKALGETFKGATGVAGGAILGDGRVGLILDLDRLCREGCDDAER